jgi:hypothetical protein
MKQQEVVESKPSSDSEATPVNDISEKESIIEFLKQILIAHV